MKNRYLVSVLSVLIGLMFGYAAHSYMVFSAKKKIDRFAHSTLKSNNVSYKIERIDPFRGHITLSNVVVSSQQTGMPLRIDRIDINKFDSDRDLPRYASFAIKGVHIPMDTMKAAMTFNRSTTVPLDVLPQICEVFRADELLMDMSIDYRYRDSLRRFNIKNLSLNFRSIAGVEMEADISGIPLPGTPINPSEITVSSFALAVRDDGIRDCIVDFITKSKGIPERTLMKQAWYSLKVSSMSDNALRSIYNFVSGESKGVAMVFRPKKPVNVMALFQILRSPVQLQNLPVAFHNF